MKTYISILFILLLNFNRTSAQQKELHHQVERALRNATAYNAAIDLSPQYQQKGFVFGLAIRINAQGRADSVLFTNRTNILDSLVLFKSVTENLKKDKKSFLNYKNSVLVSLVLVRRGYDPAISNFPDAFQRSYSPENISFDEYFAKAMPDVGRLSANKKIILLPTINLIFAKPQR